MEKGKELVKVLVEFNGDTLFFETPLAIIACKEEIGANVNIMGTANTKKLLSMGAAIDSTIAKNIDPIEAIDSLLESILNCNRDCENCKEESQC